MPKKGKWDHLRDFDTETDFERYLAELADDEKLNVGTINIKKAGVTLISASVFEADFA